MKSRPHTGHERLLDTLKSQRSYYDTSMPPTSKYHAYYKDFTGSQKLNLTGGKEINDYYHVKTHFKTLESMALDLHASIRSESKDEIKLKISREKQGQTNAVHNRSVILPGHNRQVSSEIKGLSEFDIILSREDVIPLSSEILQKFRVWKPQDSSHLRKQLKG